jgi:hypothetical protein
VEANSTGGQGSRKAVAPSDDDDDDDDDDDELALRCKPEELAIFPVKILGIFPSLNFSRCPGRVGGWRGGWWCRKANVARG